MNEHLDQMRLISKSTAESVREGFYIHPQFIVDGIKEELQQAIDFNWIDDDQRKELEGWMDSALEG